jgi:repressor LexA
MVDAKISDGDLVVVEADEDPPDGSVVVALLEGDEVTVKRLYRHDRHVNHDQKNRHDQKNQNNGTVRLKAESAAHEDIVVPLGEVEIQGRVVASIHSF